MLEAVSRAIHAGLTALAGRTEPIDPWEVDVAAIDDAVVTLCTSLQGERDDRDETIDHQRQDLARAGEVERDLKREISRLRWQVMALSDLVDHEDVCRRYVCEALPRLSWDRYRTQPITEHDIVPLLREFRRQRDRDAGALWSASFDELARLGEMADLRRENEQLRAIADALAADLKEKQ